jgi:hypothetical protein
MKLNLELQILDKSIKKPDVIDSNFVVLLSELEPLDWAFLNHPGLSKPFWDKLKAAAPEFLYKGVKALLPKGTKKRVSKAEIIKELPEE